MYFREGITLGREDGKDIRSGLCYEHRKKVQLGIYGA
jgi:hypothetical protein